MPLQENVTSYLEAEGFNVSQRSLDLIVGNKPSMGGQREYVYVWAPEQLGRRDRSTLTRTLMADFGEAAKESPRARRFLVLETSEGFSPEFRSDARRYFDVNLLAPIEFFDTNFRWDDARGAATAAKRLQEAGQERSYRRVRQPYQLASDGGGDDLLGTLVDVLRTRTPDAPSIHLVIGPAGMGKSHLFSALFAELYKRFMADKRALRETRRPFPLLPDHLDFADSVTFSAILDAYLRTELARPVDRSVFEWMLTSGYGTWLLDGLDEVIARDIAFFSDFVLDLLTRPTAAPRILICIRDSLLATNAELHEFMEMAADEVEVYRLCDWSHEQRREYAQKRFTTDGERSGYVSVIDEDERLRALSRNPFYCTVIAEAYEQGTLEAIASESDVFDVALEAIVRREREKGLLRAQLVPDDAVRELLMGVAAENLSTGFKGVFPSDIEIWAELVLPEQVTAEERQEVVTQLLQFPLFGGSESGRIRFVQELIERYLLAEWFIATLSTRDAFMRRLATAVIPWEWPTLELVAEELDRSGRSRELYAMAYECVSDDIAFKNVMQLISFSHLTNLEGLPMEHRDLGGLRFQAMDLTGVSFRGSDLSDAEFVECQLRNAIFAGAVIRNTSFEVDDEALRGVDVGDLGAFYSMRTTDGLVQDMRAAASWFQERSQQTVVAKDPCESALQLRHLFGKFVYPTGEVRRHWIGRRAATRGTRYADPENALEAAMRHGYLVEEPVRNRVERPPGEYYSELVAYVRSLQLSPGLRQVLDDLCDRQGCHHVPPL